MKSLYTLVFLFLVILAGPVGQHLLKTIDRGSQNTQRQAETILTADATIDIPFDQQASAEHRIDVPGPKINEAPVRTFHFCKLIFNKIAKQIINFTHIHFLNDLKGEIFSYLYLQILCMRN